VTTFFFVRHGVTAHTGHKLSGWMEGIHLTDRGREQADAAGRQLAGTRLTAIYSSPIDRCHETALAIAGHHKRLKVQTRRSIGEVDYGKWTDRSLKSLMRTKLWTTVQRWPSAMRFPDGETLRSVQSRAVEEVERLREAHPKGRVCCVSHGDVIKLVLAHYLGLHIDLYQRIVIAPASISTISLGGGDPRIWSLNALPMTIPHKEADQP
jgi:probable phosphoglycerate mutase